MGVLVDDLVTKGTKEPYRMMTSRAEFRLALREDNTLERLAPRANEVGLLSDVEWEKAEKLLSRRRKMLEDLERFKLVPNERTQSVLRQLDSPVLLKPVSAKELMRREEIACLDLMKFGVSVDEDDLVYEPVEIQVKYEGYIKRQNEMIEQAVRLENLQIPADLDFKRVRGLSNEEVEKLTSVRPLSLGQAGRVSGVNPSAIQALMIFLKGQDRQSSIGRAN